MQRIVPVADSASLTGDASNDKAQLTSLYREYSPMSSPTFKYPEVTSSSSPENRIEPTPTAILNIHTRVYAVLATMPRPGTLACGMLHRKLSLNLAFKL